RRPGASRLACSDQDPAEPAVDYCFSTVIVVCPLDDRVVVENVASSSTPPIDRVPVTVPSRDEEALCVTVTVITPLPWLTVFSLLAVSGPVPLILRSMLTGIVSP